MLTSLLADESMTVRVILSESEVYVGQPFTYEVEWVLGKDVNQIHAVDFHVPVFAKKGFKIHEPATAPVDGRNTIGIPVSNMRIIGVTQGRVIRFSRTVVAEESGNFELKPARLRCSRTVDEGRRRRRGFQYPSYFDNQFFADATGPGFEEVEVLSNSLSLEVMDLPSKGKPETFSGIVGACRVDMVANPTELRVGEPLTLEILVFHQFPETIEIPRLNELGNYRGRFKIPEERAFGIVRQDHRLFRQSLRPQSAAVDEVPPFGLHWFDPVSKSYQTAVSESILLKVKPGGVANAFEATLSDGSSLRNVVKENREGIHHNYSSDEITTKPRGSFLVPSAAWQWWLLLLGPALGFILFLLTTRRWRYRRRDPEFERALYAWKDFSVAVKHARNREEICTLMDRYFAAKFRISEKAVTWNAIDRHFQKEGIPRSAYVSLQDQYEQVSKNQFSKGSSVSSKLETREVVSLIRRLETLLGVLMICGLLCAQLDASPVDTADEYFKRGKGKVLDDPEMAQEQFLRAALYYREGLQQGAGNAAKLHMNAGNSYFYGGDLGHAILHYRNAERLHPGNALIQDSLRYARSQVVDRFSVPTTHGAIRKIFFWHGWDYPVRCLVFALVFILSWILCGVYFVWSTKGWKRGIFVSFGVAVLLGISLTITGLQRLHPQGAVILAPEVMGKKGDSEIYEDAFLNVLHGGTECRLIERRGSWYRVRFSSGDTCWLPKGALGILY